MKILVLNSGSSSQKACLYQIGESLPNHAPACLWEGRIEWKGSSAATIVKSSKGATQKKQLTVSSRQRLVRDLLSTLWSGEARVVTSVSEVAAVGHRVVHGGPHFEAPVVITPEVREAIASVSTFAPLHITAELEGVDAIGNLLGPVPQIAVFDTGFHRQMPMAAAVYPGPYEWLYKWHSPLRISWHQPSILHRTRSSAAWERQTVAQTRELPFGQWLFGDRN